MTDFAGLILLMVAGGMITIARPTASQDCAPFLRVWFVGQAYLMLALIVLVTGIGLLIGGRLA
jgi:hypothetical protein